MELTRSVHLLHCLIPLNFLFGKFFKKKTTTTITTRRFMLYKFCFNIFMFYGKLYIVQYIEINNIYMKTTISELNMNRDEINSSVNADLVKCYINEWIWMCLQSTHYSLIKHIFNKEITLCIIIFNLKMQRYCNYAYLKKKRSLTA